MSLLVFQVVIKQWDRSQCTPDHANARAAIPVRYTVFSKPAYFVLDKPCIVDQHGDDIATSVFKSGRITYGIMPDQRIRFDRFQVCGRSEGDSLVGDTLEYLSTDKKVQRVGQLHQGWIQCQYNWRYSVEEGGQRYWMYEEVTLNAACMEEFDADYFLTTDPVITFTDEQL